MCCQHIIDGAYADASAISAADPDAFVSFRVDLLDDSTEMLDVVLCRECANQFGRATGEVLAGRRFEDAAALPWIAPFCNFCLLHWTSHGSLGGIDGPKPKAG
jgi:hypothetical protein